MIQEEESRITFRKKKEKKRKEMTTLTRYPLFA